VLVGFVLIASSASACGAQRSSGALGDLATEWGGAEEPRCRTIPGESLEASSDTPEWECEWLHRASGENEERIWELRNSSDTALVLFWSRSFTTPEARRQVMDWLNVAL